MNRTLAIIGVAVLAVFGLEVFLFPVLNPLENRLLDSFVRNQAAALAPDPDIVLVDVDEKSLVNMKDAGRFPWPREVYATLIAGLAAQKPRAIVFDIMFSEPDQFRPESDAAFIETASLHDNIFFPMVWLDSKFGEPAAKVAAQLGLIKGLNADPEARIAVIPPQVLPPKMWRTGTINFLADSDGVGRRYELRRRIGGVEPPSLSAPRPMCLGYPLPHADGLLLP